MEKKEIYKRFPRRKLSKVNYTTPDLSMSPRVLIDRVAKGLPVSAKLTKHIPLPPDGMIADDFVTGTEEITDVTDAMAFADEIRKQQEHIAKEKEKARKEAIGATEPPAAPPADSHQV